MNRFLRPLYCIPAIALITLVLSSCTTIDIYEKSVTIPGHSWKSSYKPSFDFTIKDTTVPYSLFIILRHTDKYSYNNIYVNVYAKQPGSDSTQKVQYSLRLGTDNEGWLGSGMDDIYEHRIPLTSKDQQFYFKKPGMYTFTVEQIMREDPLKHILNVGLRIEKQL